ncbi:MAG: hypothetical protein AAF725_07480 [Acidobacteriota bacterium]
MTARLLLAFMAALLAWPSFGQAGGDFSIRRSTIDGGGSFERSTESITLRGTVGQPDVGVVGLGVRYLTGGFWATEGRLGIFFFDGFESGDTTAWSMAVGEAPAAPPAPAVGSSSADFPASETQASKFDLKAPNVEDRASESQRNLATGPTTAVRTR